MNSEDLTARARIRDAAIKLFAERGIERATIRDIAHEAGVSSGLLRHHFGSKEGLRDACDEYALSRITTLGRRFTEFGVFDGMDPGIVPLQRYMARSLLDGSPTAQALLDRVIEYGESWLAAANVKSADPRAYLAVISVMKLSLFTMGDQLSHLLGEDVAGWQGWKRVLKATLEIFSQPLVTPEQADMARGVIDRLHTPEEQL